MVIIRPIRDDDLGQLLELAAQASFGLTTLPKDERLLQQRIEKSLQSFRRSPTAPAVSLTCSSWKTYRRAGWWAQAGSSRRSAGSSPSTPTGSRPRCTSRRCSRSARRSQTLHLVREHNGPTEIGSLFLSPRPPAGVQRPAAVAVALPVHGQPPRRLRPAGHRRDARGRGQKRALALLGIAGRHFFEVEYPTADYLSMIDKKFIADPDAHLPDLHPAAAPPKRRP